MKNSLRNFLLKEKKLVLNNYFILTAFKKKLTLSEFIILAYFDNDSEKLLNLEQISQTLRIDNEEVIQSFNNLLAKNLISINTKKDSSLKMIEVIDLTNYYKEMEKLINDDEEKSLSGTIFTKFEKELGRTLSPMEYEIINGWLEMNISEELIIGALKEAVYNGVTNMRYIDKILFEWNKKHFKTMNDVKNFVKKKDEEKEVDLFDYDWLNDDD